MTLEKSVNEEKETKWIFRYIRGDLEEIDIGPYKTQEEAKGHRDKMSGFGAICSAPIEVSKDYELYKG
ncbi:hypothetical protein HZA33_01880 [Candidatus Pacearchaeota archaeon]|nr:hypothetical protein [Candidatus Pacearchaeota archaeon]